MDANENAVLISNHITDGDGSYFLFP
jgi:hypothetical protein